MVLTVDERGHHHIGGDGRNSGDSVDSVDAIDVALWLMRTVTSQHRADADADMMLKRQWLMTERISLAELLHRGDAHEMAMWRQSTAMLLREITRSSASVAQRLTMSSLQRLTMPRARVSAATKIIRHMLMTATRQSLRMLRREAHATALASMLTVLHWCMSCIRDSEAKNHHPDDIELELFCTALMDEEARGNDADAEDLISQEEENNAAKAIALECVTALRRLRLFEPSLEVDSVVEFVVAASRLDSSLRDLAVRMLLRAVDLVDAHLRPRMLTLVACLCDYSVNAMTMTTAKTQSDEFVSAMQRMVTEHIDSSLQAMLSPTDCPEDGPELRNDCQSMVHRHRDADADVGVLSTAPVRIDISGGWSDTPPICYESDGAVRAMMMITHDDDDNDDDGNMCMQVLNVAITVDNCRPMASASRVVKHVTGTANTNTDTDTVKRPRFRLCLRSLRPKERFLCDAGEWLRSALHSSSSSSSSCCSSIDMNWEHCGLHCDELQCDVAEQLVMHESAPAMAPCSLLMATVLTMAADRLREHRVSDGCDDHNDGDDGDTTSPWAVLRSAVGLTCADDTMMMVKDMHLHQHEHEPEHCLELYSLSTLPVGSGLGGSSILAATALTALTGALYGVEAAAAMSKERLSYMVMHASEYISTVIILVFAYGRVMLWYWCVCISGDESGAAHDYRRRMAGPGALIFA